MVDLDKPVTVRVAGKAVFEGIAPRSAEVIRETLAERGDPSGIFTAEIGVDLGGATEAPSGPRP
jgi:hypothetical protein